MTANATAVAPRPKTNPKLATVPALVPPVLTFPCPPWCIGCGVTAVAGETSRYHSSATVEVTVKAYIAPTVTLWGDSILGVSVDRTDFSDTGRVGTPHIYLSSVTDRDGIAAINAHTARRLAHAVIAQQNWMSAWVDGVDRPMVPALIDSEDGDQFQVGVDVDHDVATLFVNYVQASPALVRRMIHEAAKDSALTRAALMQTSIDFGCASAGIFAETLIAAAALADGIGTPTCPSWCTRHVTDSDGSILHEGTPVEVEVGGDGGLVGGTVELKLNRYDEDGDLGLAAICLSASQDGIDLTSAEFRALVDAGMQLAKAIEVTA